MTPLEISLVVIVVFNLLLLCAKDNLLFFVSSFIGSVITSINTFFITKPAEQSLSEFWLVYAIVTIVLYLFLKGSYSTGSFDGVDIDFD